MIWFVTSLYEKKYLSNASHTATKRDQTNQSGAAVMSGLEVPE